MPNVKVEHRAHVIVLGNEKGGSGKSTMAMHLIVGLLRDGCRVGAIDLDTRQATLSSCFKARTAFAAARGLDLPHPRLIAAVPRSERDSRVEAEAGERAGFDAALRDLGRACDIVVIDCPGADAPLSRHAHAHADTLLTPINDSFVDFAMLARMDPEDHDSLTPGVYSEVVWQARKRRFARDRGRINWVVARNRIGAQPVRDLRDVGAALDALARRVGFRAVPGLGERTIFRELYLHGLTLMDVREAGLGLRLDVGHVAARAELRALTGALRLRQTVPAAMPLHQLVPPAA